MPKPIPKYNPLGPFKIRERVLRGYCREVGGYASWREYQVVQGRTIISRHELRSQAEEAKRKYEA